MGITDAVSCGCPGECRTLSVGTLPVVIGLGVAAGYHERSLKKWAET